MMELDCSTLCNEVIENGCNYQVVAISEDEMKALIKAHLVQEHEEAVEGIDDSDYQVIYSKISNLFDNN